MCGIFGYLTNDKKKLQDKTFIEKLKKEGNKSKHRGPDNTTSFNHLNFYLMFHRLCINDISEKGNQPFTIDDIALICNGEIYNFKELADKYGIVQDSNSDCEVILHLYKKLGFKKTVELLDGVFAILLIDYRDSNNFIFIV